MLGQFFQPCAVFGRLVGNRIVFVHPIHSLFAEPRDIGVGKRDRFHYVAAGLNGFGGIDITAADADLCGKIGMQGRQQQRCREQKNMFHLWKLG